MSENKWWRVYIEQAYNGWIVHSGYPGQDTKYVCKSVDEVTETIHRVLNEV